MKKSYTKEIEGSVVVVPGTKIEFQNNIFETENKDIIKFLDNSESCKKMQGRGIFVKVTDKTLNAAKETLEQREARAKKELEEIKKQKAKDSVKPTEKGRSKAKVGDKDKPKF